MKFVEFYGIDVMAEMEQRIQESINESRPNLVEAIEDDQQEIDVFVDMALGYSISESDLVVSQCYYPILFSSILPKKLLQTTVTMKEAEFLGIVNGRLEFKFANSDRSIFFPADITLINKTNWHRFVFDNKSSLDSFAVTLMMKFSNRDWIIKTDAYSEKGECNVISNLSFVPKLS